MFPGTGCVIDGSHMNSIDFTLAVIDLAIDAGFDIDDGMLEADLEWMNSEEDDEDRLLDILNALDWTYQDALDFLNSGLPDGLYYTVECNCLILEDVE